jgi:hypothetical protein
MQKGRQQVPALAALGARWWEGVEHALAHTATSAPWETLGQGVPAVMGLWGTPRSPHTRRMQTSQGTAGMRGSAGHGYPRKAGHSMISVT